jgi:hypothetical protein
MKPMNTGNDDEQSLSLLAEFAAFLHQHKMWWLVPLVVVAVLFAVLIFVSGTATTPFIYQTH